MIKCPLCEFQVNNEDFKEKYISDYNNIEYKLYYCQKCNCEWWEPLCIIPEFYEDEGESLYELIHKGIRSLNDFNISFFKNFPLKKGRLLDVGCGDGIFLVHAERLGFEVWGIDFDKKSIKVAKERYKLKNVYNMSLEEFTNFAEREKIKFDIITFFEVLEHQDKPREFIDNVKKLLNRDGYIAGTVPNRDCFFIRLYRGKLEKTDLPPHHFIRFSKRVIKSFLEDSGFSVEVSDTKTLSEIATLLELYLIGKYSFSFKKKLRETLYGSDKIAKKNFGHILIKTLKNLRTFLFFPLSIFIFPFIEGAHIYFQGKLK